MLNANISKTLRRERFWTLMNSLRTHKNIPLETTEHKRTSQTHQEPFWTHKNVKIPDILGTFGGVLMDS